MKSLSALFILREDSDAARLFNFLRLNWRDAAQAGQPIGVQVSTYKAKRTHAQNRYYWATLNEIAAGAWVRGRQYSADAWHDFFKGALIGKEDIPGGGTRPLSTTTLNTAEFARYVEQVEAYASTELGLDLDVTA